MSMHIVEPTTAPRMSQAVVVQLLGDLIPFLHAQGQDHFVEAVTEAIDHIGWRPLGIADRAAPTLLVAFAPSRLHPGYVAPARWMRAVGEHGLSPKDQQLAAACIKHSGGWWGSGRHGRPHQRRALAWRPWPTFEGCQPAQFEYLPVAA